MSISVLLADDHAMFLETLTARLNGESDIEVVSSVSNAGDAVTEAVRLEPDVVLMDIDMPGMICFEAAETIRNRCPETRVVFLSAFFNDAYIEQALAVKAIGYVVKSESVKMVIDAVRAAAAGRSYFSDKIVTRMVVDSDGVGFPANKNSRVGSLTLRELTILRYLARGMTKKEIAQMTHRSVNTVNRHTTNLMNKLAIHDRVELARFAIREGLAEA